MSSMLKRIIFVIFALIGVVTIPYWICYLLLLVVNEKVIREKGAAEMWGVGLEVTIIIIILSIFVWRIGILIRDGE